MILSALSVKKEVGKMKRDESIPGKITKDATLAQILERPEASKILSKYNLPCLHCPMAKYEIGILKIGEVAKTYGIDIDSLLRDLNKMSKRNQIDH